MVSRYVANGPVKQEGICLMPPHPRQYGMLPPHRTDGYHVATPPSYVQQPPPNQGNNQVQPLRAMPPTGPPNQSSTPPNSDLKVQMQQQQPTMNMAYVSQIPVRGPAPNMYPRAPQQTTQTSRMPNHRQGQQHMYQTQPQYVPLTMQPSVPFLNSPTPYYNGGPRPQPGYVATPFTMIPGQLPSYPYQPAQNQPATYFYPSAQVIGTRPQITSITAVQQNPTQPTASAMPLPQPSQQMNSITMKKRPFAIAIIDPMTGKDKLNEIYEQDDSHPPSGESSARQTPQPPLQNSTKEVQAQFARQVTEAIKDKEIPVIEDFDTSPIMDQMGHIYSLPPQTVPHQRYDIHNSKLQAATKEFIPASLNNAAKETTPVVSAITDAVEVTITNKPKDRESPVKGRKQREQINTALKEPVTIKEDIIICEKPICVPEEEIKMNDNESIATSIAHSKESIVTHLDNKINTNDITTPVSTEPVGIVQEALPEYTESDEPLFNPDAVASNAKSKQASIKTQELPKPPPQQQLQPSQPHPQHIMSTSPPVPVQKVVVQSMPAPVPITQPTKPNNKSSKLRDINLKGALKEGTDMDVFNDNTEEHSLTNRDYVNSDYVNNDNNVMLNNNEDTNKNNDITTIKPIMETKPKSKFDVMDIVKDTPKPIKPLIVPTPVESPDEVDRAVLANEKLVQAKNEVNAKSNTEIIDTNPPEPKINLNYREDQWSPFNLDGKKVYGFDFLMALRNDPKSKVKPNSNIPTDIIANDARGRGGDPNKYAGGPRQTDFTPSFGSMYANKNSSRGQVVKRKSQQGAPGGANKPGNRPSMIRVSISVKEDVKLREVENAWRPARLVAGQNMTEDEKKTAELYKKFRGVLNKLTPQKFSQLLDQVKALQIDNTETLQGVIDLVFEKAVDEPNFSVAYANLCKELSLMQVPTGDVKANDKEGQSSEFVNFRKLLVTRCQLEFEKNSIDEGERNEKVKEIELCQDPEKKKEMQSDLEEYDRRLRMKSVGNIRFIGELFKQNMLTANIMLRCLNILIGNKDEESLECLCKLISTIGKELETRKLDLNPIFGIMRSIVGKKQEGISSRVRFMIQDVLDLRQSQWVPRRQDFNPKTMDQIQKEAENEQFVIQAMNSVPITPRKDDRLATGGGQMNNNTDRRNRSRNVGNDEGGWMTTQNRNNRGTPFNVQSDKLKIATPLNDEPFGSSAMFYNWSTGSNVKPSVTSHNMYSALENMNTDIEKRQSMNTRTHNKDHYHSKGPSLDKGYRQSYEDGRGSRSGSQHRPRENSVPQYNVQPSSMSQSSVPSSTYSAPSVAPAAMSKDPPVVVPAVVEMTPEIMETQFRKILEDYLTDFNIVECDKDFKRIFPASELPNVVTEVHNSVLERSKTAREGTGQLFAKIMQLGTLSVEDYCTGLTNVLSDATDLIIDIPKLWDYLGELIAPVLCEKVLSIKDLHKCCSILISQSHASKLLTSIFKIIMKDKSPNFLHSLWISSGLSLNNFMHESREINGFIKDNQFEFLLQTDFDYAKSPAHKPCSLTQDDIYSKLVTFFKSKASFDDIVNWIMINVGEGVQQNQFIRALATACFEESIVQNKFKLQILKCRFTLLLRYVDSKPEYELQCLFALQALINKLEHPSGLLLFIFDKMYEENMFSYESFIAWEQSSDPAEQEGKGVSLMQLTSFFTNLREADDESSGSSEETGG